MTGASKAPGPSSPSRIRVGPIRGHGTSRTVKMWSSFEGRRQGSLRTSFYASAMMSRLTCRHPTEADLPLMAEVSDKSNRGIPFYRPITMEELRVETFGSEDFDSKGAMIVLDGDTPLAVGEVIVAKARVEHGLNEGWMRLYVVPRARGQGIEEMLMSFMEEYLRGRGVEKALARYYTVDPWFKGVTEKAGLTEVRRFSYLDFVSGQELPDAPLPADVLLERYDFKQATKEQVKAFLDIDNEVFAEHWGHAPKPLEELLRWQMAVQDVFCITIAKSGSRPVGVTFLEDSVLYNRENGTNEGWVDDLGVVKERRHRGLGRALLVDGIHWLLDRGLDTIHIGVDTENARALTLYTSVGFRLMEQMVVVQKVLGGTKG